MKKSFVEPAFRVPYLILVCLAKSSALSIGDSIFVMVKNAAKLAVYEDIMIRVKNHHRQATIRVEIACGAISQPSVQEARVSGGVIWHCGSIVLKHGAASLDDWRSKGSTKCVICVISKHEMVLPKNTMGVKIDVTPNVDKIV